MKKWIFLIFIFSTSYLFAEETAGNKTLEERIANGKKVFRKKACGGCHKIGGSTESSVGPDLKDVTERREHKWLMDWIRDPRIKQKEKDPIYVELMKKYPTKMPYLKLSDSDIEDILEYIKSESNKKKGK